MTAVTTHEADITEDGDGAFTASCTCGWTDMASYWLRDIAVYAHSDHVQALIDEGVTT